MKKLILLILLYGINAQAQYIRNYNSSTAAPATCAINTSWTTPTAFSICANGVYLSVGGSSSITGSGTSGTIPKFTATGAIGNSLLTDSGTGAFYNSVQLATQTYVGTTITSQTAYLNPVSIGLSLDNGDTAITTGVKGYIYVPSACTLNSATLLADVSGSIVIDIWKVAFASYPPTVANTITASAKPTLSGAISSQNTTLTGWTTSISAGDTLGFNVDSAATVKKVTLILKCTRS